VEQARMQAAVRLVEPYLAAAPASVAEEAHRLLATARTHLATALALWRKYLAERKSGSSSGWRATRQSARRHLRLCRRHWSQACRTARSMMVGESSPTAATGR
jgi:hypothetical protein